MVVLIYVTTFGIQFDGGVLFYVTTIGIRIDRGVLSTTVGLLIMERNRN